MIALEVLREEEHLALGNSSLVSETAYVSVVVNVWPHSRMILQ